MRVLALWLCLGASALNGCYRGTLSSAEPKLEDEVSLAHAAGAQVAMERKTALLVWPSMARETKEDPCRFVHQTHRGFC